MKVSEAMKRLAELPPDAVLCFVDYDQERSIRADAIEVWQIDLVLGTSVEENGYTIDDAGDKRIAVVA